MKKTLLSILFFGVVGFISYLMYIDHKTNNEWLFQFSESDNEKKSSSCKVYSHRINGVEYSTTIGVGYLEKKYVKLEFDPVIEFSRIDIIKSKTVGAIIDNNESQVEVSYLDDDRMSISTDLLNRVLYVGKKITLKMMKTDGEDFIVSFQGNEQFATQVDKCRKIMASKLEEYGKLQ